MNRLHHRLLLLLALAALAAPAAAELPGWQTSLDRAVELAADGDRFILVDLYADWCGWCRELEKKVFASAEFRSYTKDWVLLHVDVDDGGEGAELQQRFDAFGLPTTLILDSRLVRIGTVTGFAPSADFIRRLRAEIESWTLLLEYYEKVRHSADPTLLRPLAEELRSRGDGARTAEIYRSVLSRVPENSETAAWLHYLIADGHRMDRQFRQASESLARARRFAAELPDLSERVDLLSVRIAQDAGHCREAVSELKAFVRRYPKSSHRRDAKRAIRTIRVRRDGSCA